MFVLFVFFIDYYFLFSDGIEATQQKLNVISHAEKTETGLQAAGREFDVDERCIWRWQTEKEEIKKMPQIKEQEEMVNQIGPYWKKSLAWWVKEQREIGIGTSTVKLRL